jgi:hypothetical protein
MEERGKGGRGKGEGRKGDGRKGEGRKGERGEGYKQAISEMTRMKPKGALNIHIISWRLLH